MSRGALLLFLALTLASSCRAQDGGQDVARRRKGPWFCHGCDCPRFKTVGESSEYSLRCYERSTWAVSCVFNAFMPDAVLLANARVLDYVRENDLWGATPFASLLHFGLDSQAAWANGTAASFAAAATAAAPADPSPEALAAFEGGLHKTVCAAYFLPEKYQAGSSRAELDRRPPRPSKDSHVRIYRAPRFEAFVSGFPGFPTPPRFIWEAMRLAHSLKWSGEDFKCGTALFYVYDPPSATAGRWNEVLIPARRFHDLLMTEGEELFVSEEGEDAAVVTAVQ